MSEEASTDFDMEKYSYYEICQVLNNGTMDEIQKVSEDIGPDALINKGKWTLLHAASIRGKSDVVQFLIESGSNVNALDKDDKSALYYCQSNETAKMLIRAGANVNQPSVLGKTPLHYASYSVASPSVVEVILQSGGQINAEDKFGNTPFLNACDMAYGCIDEEEYVKCLPKIELLIKHNADIHHSNLKNENGLHICSQHGSFEIADMLLKRGVNVNAKSKTGQTPLIVAFSHQHTALSRRGAILTTIEILLQNGADPTLADEQGITALHELMLHPSLISATDMASCMNILVESSASLNARDNMLRSPLHYASFSTAGEGRWPDLLCELMKHGGDINAQDVEGFTSTMLTASHAHENPTDMLTYPWDCFDGSESVLELVDWNAARKQGVTLAHIVSANKTLKFCGSPVNWDINAQDEFLSTPIHYAEFTGNTRVIKYLWFSGSCADLTLKDCLDNSVIDCAVAAFNQEILAALEDYAGKSVVGEQMRLPDSSCNVCEHMVQERNSCYPFQKKEEPTLVDPSKVEINPVANMEEYLWHILHTPRLGKVLQNAEVMEIQRETEALMWQILQKVAARDVRFHSEMILSGSVREKTKAGLPDEFDIMCKLEYFSSLCEVVDEGACAPGFVRFKAIGDNSEEQNIDEFFDSSGYLVPYLVRSKFEELVRLVVFDSELWKNCRICSNFALPSTNKGISHPKPSIIIELCWNGPIYKNMIFSVDLVPVIDVGPFWPKNAVSCGPVLENLHKQCLFTMTIPRFEIGVYNNEVRISFSLMESATFDRIPEVVKDAYITAKAIREICPTFVDSEAILKEANYSNSSLIPSYWLKMAVFHELDEHGFDESNSLAVWVRRIFHRVSRYVSEGVFPSYFMPQQDFIASKLRGRDKTRNLSVVENEFKACQKLCQIIQRLLSRGDQ